MYTKIKLTNGKEKSFPTSENDSYKFYRCETYWEANELQLTLQDIGNVCHISEDSRGWHVRVNK